MPLKKHKKELPDDGTDPQLSLFDNRIVWKEEKDVPLCENPKRKKRRRTMLLHEEGSAYPAVNWPNYNRAQVHEKTRFQELLYDLCANVEDIPRAPGAGRSRLPLSDMLFAVVYKVYSCVSARRFMSDLRDARLKGFLTHEPHFNSLYNYLELDEMFECLKGMIEITTRPFHDIEVNFASDSSGFSTGQHTRWMTEKYGKKHYDSRVKWLKCHLMCGVSTNIVTSVSITSRFVGDHGEFEGLLEETARSFELNHIYADKAYLSQKNLRLVHDRGGMAFIPFKPNNTLGGKDRDPVWKNMYHFFHLHRGRFLKYYNRRSNVEATFSMIKRKFGERLRSKTESAQVNEILCKILCHNICCVIHAMYELGLETDFRRISA